MSSSTQTANPIPAVSTLQPDQVKKDFQNGWHFALAHALHTLSSLAAQIGIDIKDELLLIENKIGARFAVKK